MMENEVKLLNYLNAFPIDKITVFPLKTIIIAKC